MAITVNERYRQAIEWFAKAIPVAETELHYSNPFQLLVAVILSAQCTDRRVNQITPALFAAFPTPEALASASIDDIYSLIKSVSYPNNKAKALSGMAHMLVSEFGSTVPDNMESLIRLPGVGRKTANVILAVVFGKSAMAVDTHVFRVANRIGLTRNSRTPLQTERTLMRHIPAALVPRAHHWLILHGRYTCTARNPQCQKCGLTEICKHYLSSNAKNHPKDIDTAD